NFLLQTSMKSLMRDRTSAGELVKSRPSNPLKRRGFSFRSRSSRNSTAARGFDSLMRRPTAFQSLGSIAPPLLRLPGNPPMATFVSHAHAVVDAGDRGEAPCHRDHRAGEA